MPIAEEEVRLLSVNSYRIDNSEVMYKSLPFCEQHSLEERKAMARKMKDGYPGGIGVVLHLAKQPLRQLGKHLKDAKKPYTRVVVARDIQMSELVIHARRMFTQELPDVAGVFLYLCDGNVERIVSLSARFTEYIDRSTREDDLCHFIVTVEAVFGC